MPASFCSAQKSVVWPKPSQDHLPAALEVREQFVGRVLGRGRAVELAADQQGLDVGVAHGRVGRSSAVGGQAVAHLSAGPQEVAGGRCVAARELLFRGDSVDAADRRRVAPDLGVREDQPASSDIAQKPRGSPER